MSIHFFGRLPDGTAISEIKLSNAAGASASILTFGAALRDLVVPVEGGEPRRVVLGFETLDGYLENNRYLGVTAGRHASRIDRGRLVIDGVEHQLSLNEGGVHLHGGVVGFSRKPWRIVETDESSVTLGLLSPDGDDGYPGALDVRCTYRLLEPGTIAITMTATTDAPTVVSLAHHSYFTLQPGTSVRDHRMQLHAVGYTPLGPDLVPSGEIVDVAGTPYDFRALRPLADPKGDPDFLYDCSLVIDREGKADARGLVRAVRLVAPDESLAMEVHTTEPCLVFYDGAGLASDWPAVGGIPHAPHAGLCLEPMRYPDNPNQPAFPSAILRPGELYRQVTEYRFF
ncbi:aldose 1-epimerase [Kaistia sp. 32K]|uniref:aldose epimerase family protein n=1 Tax=Kaistia sp. 32K TaxID=2795690 RepID=UPI001915B6C8|nr:aldose epimerase family protein [Kaistia sp. 32K]BCP52051.1 aldose 1-epimerase [Kaistia sp. 32K]